MKYLMLSPLDGSIIRVCKSGERVGGGREKLEAAIFKVDNNLCSLRFLLYATMCPHTTPQQGQMLDLLAGGFKLAAKSFTHVQC